MSVDVTVDEHGLVNLRHHRRAGDGHPFTITSAEWEDLLWRAACYELEYGRLRHLPLPVPLDAALGDRHR